MQAAGLPRRMSNTRHLVTRQTQCTHTIFARVPHAQCAHAAGRQHSSANASLHRRPACCSSPRCGPAPAGCLPAQLVRTGPCSTAGAPSVHRWTMAPYIYMIPMNPVAQVQREGPAPAGCLPAQLVRTGPCSTAGAPSVRQGETRLVLAPPQLPALLNETAGQTWLALPWPLFSAALRWPPAGREHSGAAEIGKARHEAYD